MLQQTFDTLKQTFAAGHDACIDASKGLVECACRVIIKNLDDPSNPIKEWKDSPIKAETPGFKDWVSAALRLLNLTESRDDPFSKLLSQHFKLVDELGRFRNMAGPISHGKEGFSHKLSAHHRRAAVLAADALVTFLHEAYLEREPDPVTTLEPYERFPKSNALIDFHVEAEAASNEDGWLDITLRLPGDETLDLTVEPSRLLFGVDREAYKYVLGLCRDASQPPAEDDDEEAA
ncbi:abortive infection family protein [Defluviimonas sp. WL0024]|uniref:Abortive infection family protein n=1 Tax=Albidovulum salinarum TaxID=2984153 RepID=A0ABT2X600_9RHOB|nr:abortive infection family protein [Defluviimonas sp. WL0024]MCU9849372.1 abortive infection family protein [Defluviimonas sp. WL0024]